MTETEFAEFIKSNRKHNYIEDRILTRTMNAIKESGDRITEVWYDPHGFEKEVVDGSKTSVRNVVFNLDEAFLITEQGHWIRFILGNEWDAISDYNVSFEDVLKPVNDWIEKHY